MQRSSPRALHCKHAEGHGWYPPLSMTSLTPYPVFCQSPHRYTLPKASSPLLKTWLLDAEIEMWKMG